MSRTAAAEADMADDSSAIADAYYEEATNFTFREVSFEDEVVGYQCFDNGSILVPLNEGGNQTVHSPEDVNEKFHKVGTYCGTLPHRLNKAPQVKKFRGRTVTN